MNERIKELIEQAGIESYPAKLLVNTDEEGKVSSKWEIPLEKFAELIVRECLNQCYYRGMNDELYEGQLKAAAFIEQHFGVKDD